MKMVPCWRKEKRFFKKGEIQEKKYRKRRKKPLMPQGVLVGQSCPPMEKMKRGRAGERLCEIENEPLEEKEEKNK